MALPGPLAAKNMPSAAADLGLGDMLTQQLQDQEEERKKKIRQRLGQSPSAFGDNTLGPATMALFGSMR